MLSFQSCVYKPELKAVNVNIVRQKEKHAVVHYVGTLRIKTNSTLMCHTVINIWIINKLKFVINLHIFVKYFIEVVNDVYSGIQELLDRGLDRYFTIYFLTALQYLLELIERTRFQTQFSNPNANMLVIWSFEVRCFEVIIDDK